MDPACAGVDRKYFPFCGDKKNWFLTINQGEDYFQPNLQPKTFNFKLVKKVPRISMEMELKTETDKIDTLENIVPIIQNLIDKKMSVFCPFCNPKERGNPENHNAVIYVDTEGVPSLFCSSCQSREKGVNKTGNYYLDNTEQYNIQSSALNIAVFRDIISDNYYFGDKSKITGDYRIDKIAKQNIPNALVSRNMAVPEFVDEVEYLHEFSRDIVLDIKNGFVNRYIPTSLIQLEPDNFKKYEIPPIIEELMRHICGESDEIFNSLIHHLAYSIQNREKLLVAFLFQGVQGTGKGL